MCLTWLRSKLADVEADAVAARITLSGRYPASAAAPANAAPVPRKRRREICACHGLEENDSVGESVTRNLSGQSGVGGSVRRLCVIGGGGSAFSVGRRM